jgi:hypothetical protein
MFDYTKEPANSTRGVSKQDIQIRIFIRLLEHPS